MSYEGYSQFLCKKGHYWTEDCYLADKENCKCPICFGSVDWENQVNITNGSFEDGERIDGFVELKIKSEISGQCSNCKGKHRCEVIYENPNS